MRDLDEFLADVQDVIEWQGSTDAASWASDGSHEVETSGDYYGLDRSLSSPTWRIDALLSIEVLRDAFVRQVEEALSDEGSHLDREHPGVEHPDDILDEPCLLCMAIEHYEAALQAQQEPSPPVGTEGMVLVRVSLSEDGVLVMDFVEEASPWI